MRALSQIGSTRMAELVSAKLQQFIVLRLLTLQTLDRAIESTVAALGMAWQVRTPCQELALASACRLPIQ